MPIFGEFLYGSEAYVTSVPGDTAAITHNVVLDGVGLMTAGVPTRSDVTSAIPRLSIGAEQRQHTDFSERDTFGHNTWHHGFGELEFSDRAKFFTSEGVHTLVPHQLTLGPAIYTHQFSANADGSSSVTDVDGTVRAHAEFVTNSYFLIEGDTAAKNALYYWNETPDKWILQSAATTAMDTASGSASPKDLQVFGSGTNQNLYIAQGEAVNMVRLNSNLSTAADNGVPAKFLASFAGKLWRADNLNEIYYSADPHSDGSATWTAPTGMNDGTVGDSTFLIRGMCVHDSALWIGKDDGIYRIYNSSTAAAEIWTVEKVIDLNHMISEFNGQAMMSFGGNLYFTVDRTLGKYDGATVQYIGPDRGANATESAMQLKSVYDTALPQDINTEPSSFNSGIVGTIRSMTNDGTNIYVAVDTGGDATGGSAGESRVMIWNGTGWHTLYSTNQWADTAITTHSAGDFRVQFVSFIPRKGNAGWTNYPRIVIGNNAIVNEAEGGYIKEDRIIQMYFPRWGHNLLDDLAADGTHNMAFQKTGHLITSWFDGGLPDVEKTFFDLIVEAQNIGIGTANNSIKVEYQVDNIDLWHEMHQVSTVGADNNDLIVSSPTQKLTFPDNGVLDKSIYAKKIRLKFTLNRATTGGDATTGLYQTPVLKSWGYHFVVRPESRYGWNMTIKCYDNLIDLQRRKVDKSAQELRQYLYTLRDQKVPIVFHDGTQLPQIKNKVLNPSMEYLTGIEGTAPNGYTAVSCALATTTKYRAHGSRSMSVVPATATADSTVTIGTYTVGAGENIFAAASTWVPHGADTIYLQILRADASVLIEKEIASVSASGDYGDIYLINKTRWTRTTLFYEDAPAGEVYTFRIIRKAADANNTNTFYVDTTEFSNNGPNNLKVVNYDYVDGDQLRCRWLGTPHNSESVRQSGYQVYITGITEAYRYPEVKQGSTSFDSEMTISVREVS